MGPFPVPFYFWNFRMGPGPGGGSSDAIFFGSYTTNYVGMFLGNGDGTFNETTTFPGSAPHGLVSADLNGDGAPDLAFVNYGGNNVSVLLGNSNGTWGAINTFAVATKPYAIAVADLNGDGKVDLITGQYAGSNGVTVLLGNGNGSFQAGVNFAAGTFVNSLALGVTTTSGHLDLCVANDLSSTVSLLLGNGNGTFGAATAIATGGFPQNVLFGQLTASGNLDLVVPCEVSAGNSSINVLLGNGNGTFKAPSTFHTGTYPFGSALVDVNGDGKLDLVVTASVDQTAIVFLGNGNGTFQAGSTFANVGAKPWSLIVSDLNGDGKVDLAIGNDLGVGEISVLLGNGNGSFQLAQTFAPSASGNFRQIAITGTGLKVSAPASVTAGIAFTYTVTAEQFNSVAATTYTGTVSFRSSDGGATLSTGAALTNGVGVFTATLATTGAQTLTATDTNSLALIGYSGTITVASAAGSWDTLGAQTWNNWTQAWGT